jgi:formylglycine-generating enzyme required for sulfatase activity
MGTPDGTCPADYPGEDCTAETGRDGFELPLHYVELTHSFEMLNTEVTQYDFAMKMGYNPSVFNPGIDKGKYCTVFCPVENLSWFAALTYANELSIEAGYPPCYNLSSIKCVGFKDVGTDYMQCMIDNSVVWQADVELNADSSYECTGYRLPTEAEWEYAARAGSLTPFYPSESQDGTISGLEDDDNLDFIGWYNSNSITVIP